MVDEELLSSVKSIIENWMNGSTSDSAISDEHDDALIEALEALESKGGDYSTPGNI